MAERRAYPRLPCNVQVDYQVVPQDAHTSILKTKTKDISAGGIRLVILEKLKPGNLLELKFLLPGSIEPVSAIGKLIWIEGFTIGSTDSSNAYDAGVAFIEISPEDKEKVNQYVQTNLK